MKEAGAPQETNPSSPSKKRSWVRRLFKALGIFLLVLCLLPFGLLVSWQISFIRRPLVQYGLSFAQVALDGKLKVKDLKGDLVTHLIIKEAQWLGRNGAPIASFARLEAHYDLWHFLNKGLLLIKKVQIEKPRGNLKTQLYGISPGEGGQPVVQKLLGAGPKARKEARQKHAIVRPMIGLVAHIKPVLPQFCKHDKMCGTGFLCKPFEEPVSSSFREWKGLCQRTPKPPPKQPASPFRMTIKEVTATGGHVSFTASPKGTVIKAEKLQFKGLFHMKGADLKARVWDLSMQTHHPHVFVRRLGVRFAMANKHIKIRDLALDLEKRSRLRLDADIRLTKSLGLSGDIKELFVTSEALRGVLPAWPLRPPISLTGKVDGSLAGLQAKLKGSVGKLKLLLRAQSDIMAQRYKARLSTKHIDLKELLGQPTLKSHLALFLAADGQGFSAKGKGQLKLYIEPMKRLNQPLFQRLWQHKTETLREDLFSSPKHRVSSLHFQAYKLDRLYLSASLSNGQARIARFKCSTPYGRLSLKGKMDLLRGSYQAKLRGLFPKLSRVTKLIGQKLGGYVRLKANIVGKKYLPVAPSRASLWISHFRHTAAKVRRARVRIRVRGQKPLQAAALSLDASGIEAGGQKLPKARVRLIYQRDKRLHQVTIKRLRFRLRKSHYRLETQSWRRGRRRALSARLSFDQSQMRATVKHLRLRRGKERIHVDGWVDLKRWRHKLKLHIKQLDLAALKRALHILPKHQLAGRVDLSADLRGSLRRPRISLHFKLQRGRYNRLKGLNTELKLAYATKEVRWRRRLQLDLKQALAGQHVAKLHASVPLAIALQGRLRGPLVLAKPAIRVYRKKKMTLDLEVPQLNLGHFKGLTQAPIKGLLKLSLQIKHTLSAPSIRLSLRLKKGSFAQPNVVFRQPTKKRKSRKQNAGSKLKFYTLKNGQSSPITKRKSASIDVLRSKLKLTHIGLSLDLNYKPGELTLLPKHNWVRHKSHTLVTLDGRFPLRLRSYTKRGHLAFRVALMQKKPLALHLTFPKRRIRELQMLLPAYLRDKVKAFRGRFDAKLSIEGDPMRPQIKLATHLEDASICPYQNGTFLCHAPIPPQLKGKGQKPESLRVKGIQAGLVLSYTPPPPHTVTMSPRSLRFQQPGKLTLSGFLKVKKHKLLALNAKRPGDDAKHSVGFPLAFGIDPRRLSLAYRLFLHKPTQLHLHIPSLHLSGKRTYCMSRKERRQMKKAPAAIADFVRMPLLRTLRGKLGLDLKLSRTLARPKLSLSLKLQKGGYLYKCSNEGESKWLDGMKVKASWKVNDGLSVASFDADALGHPVVRSYAKLPLQAGLVRKKRTYKVNFSVGRKKMYTHLLLCRFRLRRLARLGGVFEKLAGTLQGHLRLKGDPACPTFVESAPKEQQDPDVIPDDKACQEIEQNNHISITDLILGPKAQRRTKPTSVQTQNSEAQTRSPPRSRRVRSRSRSRSCATLHMTSSSSPKRKRTTTTSARCSRSNLGTKSTESKEDSKAKRAAL